jgi:hypothetical protein
LWVVPERLTEAVEVALELELAGETGEVQVTEVEEDRSVMAVGQVQETEAPVRQHIV